MIDFQKTQGRSGVSWQKTEGPHEQRFNLDDSFDRSMYLTLNPNRMHSLEFKRQTHRRQDSILKAGNVTIDLKGRTENYHDGDVQLTMPRLEIGVLNLSKMKSR